MRVGGLFSGIGGGELGLERAGFDIAWHCEADSFCQRVLERRWPGCPIYPDVRTLRGCDAEPVDVLAGGFPCQDISYAGAGAGIEGARSGLWSEFARLIGELGPRYVVVENVSALLRRGFGVVLRDLAALGYDAEWDCLPASAFGAPHRRDRIWIVAYPNGEGEHVRPFDAEVGGASQLVAYPNGVAGSTSGARQGGRGALHEPGPIVRTIGRVGGPGGIWEPEPNVGRVADGVPARMDRLRSLGNAMVPQVMEWIGRRIIEWEWEARA